MTYFSVGPGLRLSVCDKVDFGLGVQFDRLRESADNGPILPIDDAEGEHAPRTDQLVGDGGLLDRHGQELSGDHPLPGADDPSTYNPEGMVQRTRLRRRSYPSRASSVSATWAGNGPIGPVPPGAATDSTVAASVSGRVSHGGEADWT